MMKSILPVILFCCCLFSACNTTKNTTGQHQAASDMDRLYELMSGTFSSEEQSVQDTSFFNINLVMFPIWEEASGSKWLYVEQAVTEYIKRPYRQRVYQLSDVGGGMYESKVYELPQPERFIHAWETPDLFSAITADSLMAREGCAVYLKKNEEGCFSGSTKDAECLSTLRGASYATSIVTVCDDGVVSWDQGWNADGEQVWGAVKEGYVFKRKQ